MYVCMCIYYIFICIYYIWYIYFDKTLTKIVSSRIDKFSISDQSDSDYIDKVLSNFDFWDIPSLSVRIIGFFFCFVLHLPVSRCLVSIERDECGEKKERHRLNIHKDIKSDHFNINVIRLIVVNTLCYYTYIFHVIVECLNMKDRISDNWSHVNEK